MLKNSFKYCVLILVLGSFLVSCGGRRTPSPKTARSAAISYFKKYGRKYKSTPFANKNVDNVTINGIEEISYKLAFVDTIVTFVDGHAARTLVRMQKKFPNGWTVVSWEMLQYK